jgi:hypothetical protein
MMFKKAGRVWAIMAHMSERGVGWKYRGIRNADAGK